MVENNNYGEDLSSPILKTPYMQNSEAVRKLGKCNCGTKRLKLMAEQYAPRVSQAISVCPNCSAYYNITLYTKTSLYEIAAVISKIVYEYAAINSIPYEMPPYILYTGIASRVKDYASPSQSLGSTEAREPMMKLRAVIRRELDSTYTIAGVPIDNLIKLAQEYNERE